MSRILLFLLISVMVISMCAVPITVDADTDNPNYAIISPVSWGVNGNENSMGIQASRFKEYITQTSDSEIIVAVVDNGIDANHPKFEGRLVTGWGCDEGNLTPSGDHGTHVAGTIIDCTPSNVKIMPVKFYAANGGFYSTSALKDGIIQAVNAGAKIINISQGWDDGYSDGLYDEDELNRLTKEAIQYAEDHGVVIVVSAGNSSGNTKNFFPPQLNDCQNSAGITSDDFFENLITVSAIDEYDLPWYGSNYGNSVDVCAPGVDIVSSVLISTSLNSPDMRDDVADGYGSMTGTSMAAPHVSAAVAMLALEYPGATAAELKEKIKAMTVDLGEPGWDPVFGWGKIDFRMLDHPDLPSIDPVLATHIEQRHIDANEKNILEFIGLQLNMNSQVLPSKIVSAVVLPKESTDKSVMYSVANESVAQYANGRVKGVGIGTTTIVATKGELTSQTGIIHVDLDNTTEMSATTLSVGSTANSDITVAEAGDWFVFSPNESGTFVFYSSGTTDVNGYLYDSDGTLLLQNANISSTSNTNFAITCSLLKNKNYYLKVQGAVETTVGNYAIHVSKDYYAHSLSGEKLNQDARCVSFVVVTSSVVDRIRIKIGSTNYLVSKPIETTGVVVVNDARFEITLQISSTNSTQWHIKADIPSTTVGSVNTVTINMLAGNVVIKSNLRITGLIAYGSSYKTNLTPGTYVSSLLSSMATTGYTFTAYDWNDAQITATTTTKVATGTKIVQRNSSDKIVHVYYLVLFGDVTGSGVVGDGLINANDSLEVLQRIQNNSNMGQISELASDADHDGAITQEDADLILEHVVSKSTINQNYTISDDVSTECYFQTAVAF